MRGARFAVISDVHGNLPALRAVRAALAEEGPLDSVIVAGDLLLGSAWPQEVWEVLTSDRCVLVQGNTDAELAGLMKPVLDPGHPYQPAYAARYEWTLGHVDGSIRRALGNLPFEHRVNTPAGDLLVVHASPRRLDDRAGGPHNTAAEVASAYSGTGASAIAFGHWHQSFVRPTPFALLLNVASVACRCGPTRVIERAIVDHAAAVELGTLQPFEYEQRAANAPRSRRPHVNPFWREFLTREQLPSRDVDAPTGMR